MSRSKGAGFGGETLVLLDGEAKETGRLRRDTGPAGAATPSAG